MAAPPFSTLTTPKTAFPKAKPQAGQPDYSGRPSEQAPTYPGSNSIGGANDAYRTAHAGESPAAPLNTPHDVAWMRSKLIQAGYDVAATGPKTDRLSRAYAHYVATKGAGSGVWNAHNAQVVHPGVAPGGRVTGPLHAHATVAKVKPTAATVPLTSPAEQLPNDQVPGAPSLPANLQALLDKEFAPYSGDQGQPMILDPVKLAAAQANMQYGSQISQSQDNINQMLGAELGAQANITKYFQPAKDQAASNVASDDAASAANVAAQAKISPGLAAALGLTGAAAGSAQAVGNAGTQLAGNLGTITHADDVAAQGAADRREQEAHTVEDANNTIGLNSARQQLLQQLATKGQAQSVDEATNRQQNFVNRTQGIANAGEISNINATRGLAKTNIIKGMQDNSAQVQAQDINKQNADTSQTTTRAQLKQAAANLQQTLINNKRLTETPIPGNPSKTTKIPFSQIQVGDRDTLAAGLWAKVGNLPPAKAEQQINQYMTSLYGYTSTPAIRAFSKATVQQHQWDNAKKKYAQ